MGYLERSCEFLERYITEMARTLSEEYVGEGRGSSAALLEDSGHLVALKNQRILIHFSLNKFNKKNFSVQRLTLGG